MVRKLEMERVALKNNNLYKDNSLDLNQQAKYPCRIQEQKFYNKLQIS